MITSSATEVISAIVTPAILILSTSSLITATASRQSRLLERVRDLTEHVEKLNESRPGKKEFLISQLLKASIRTRLVQRALLYLYLALGSLILTSAFVGLNAFIGIANAHSIIAGIFVSLSFLFYASFLLIRESRIALKAVNAEMDYVRQLA